MKIAFVDCFSECEAGVFLSFLDGDKTLMELQMKSQYAKEHSNLKNNGHQKRNTAVKCFFKYQNSPAVCLSGLIMYHWWSPLVVISNTTVNRLNLLRSTRARLQFRV